MTLRYENGDPFTTGSLEYLDHLGGDTEGAPKIFVSIEVDGRRTMAEVDTGGVYVICNPEMAQTIDLSDKSAIRQTEVLTALGLVTGDLYRMDIRLTATTGEDLSVSGIVFVPTEKFEGLSKFPPLVLGYRGFLEHLRFGVDTGYQGGGVFYFGTS